MAIMCGLMVATVLKLLFLRALYPAWFRVRRTDPAAVQPEADPVEDPVAYIPLHMAGE